MSDVTWASRRIYELARAANKILVATHYHPDGDAAASASVMFQVLRLWGKEVTIFCFDRFAEKLRWLPGIAEAVHDEAQLDLANFDLVITVDCANLSRCRLEKAFSRGQSSQTIVEIDHHEPDSSATDYALRIPKAASTTEILYYWLKRHGQVIDPDLANAILLGLMTDTGNFFYTATSNQSLALAADLLKLGANWPKLIKTARHQADLAATRLWGLALSRLKVNRRYGVAWTILTREELAAVSESETALEELPGFLSRLTEVKAVVLLKEGDGVIRGSWRACQPQVDVARLCCHLGGGGHAKAAGFQLPGKLINNGTCWRII